MLVKVFSEDYGYKIERDMNNWLEGHPTIQIKHVVQSESGGYSTASGLNFNITLTIFYTETEDEV